MTTPARYAAEAGASAPAPSDGAQRDLGARLRTLREERGMSARQLALVLGISASAVSQIERGVMKPSVTRLLAITDALGVPLATVFDDGTAQHEARSGASGLTHAGVAVTRAWQAGPVELEGGVTFRRLSPGPTPGLDFFESVYPPDSDAISLGESGLFRHEGYEIGTVVSGELTIDLDGEELVLAAGDSVSFPCSVPHRIRNAGVRPVVATWLIVHP